MKKSYNVTTVKTISGKVDESESAGHDLNNLSYDDAVEYTGEYYESLGNSGEKKYRGRDNDRLFVIIQTRTTAAERRRRIYIY